MIQRVFNTPAHEKPDRPRSSVVGRDVYDRWLELKRSESELTQKEAADKLGLNLIQLKNAIARQRRRRGVQRMPGGQYREWISGRRR